MKYSKFVIIATSELDKRINIQFGVSELVSKGLDVEFWNISPITYNINIDSEIIKGVSYYTFTEKKAFLNKVQEYRSKDYLYLVYLNYTPATYFCFRALSKNGCDIAYCLNGIVPVPYRSKWKKLKNYDLIRTGKSILYRLLQKTPLLKPISYQLNTCLMSMADYKADKGTKMIPFKTTDFIIAQTYEDDIVGKPYYVFVDQYLPFHSDMNASGEHPIQPEKYYHQLNTLFKKIEKQTGVDVVIAAHPVASKYKDEDFFESRKVYWGKTQTLVKHSVGVLNHFSTAISFTVLYQKPSLSLISDEMVMRWPLKCENVSYRAGLLGAEVINIDHIPADPIEFKMDESKMQQYKDNYLLVPGTGDETNAEVIISIMKGNYE